MVLGKKIKKLLLLALLSAPSLSFAAIGPTPGEVQALKVVQYLYRLPEVRTHVLRLMPLATEAPDLKDTLRLIDQAQGEIVAGLPKLGDARTAQGLAASATYALGLVSADLQDLEYELLTHGKLTPEIKKDLQDVYDLYKEFGG